MVGLTRALRARGLRVAVFKCGPDYLDPTYHARAADRICHNLDGWLMGQAAVRATFTRASAGCDIALIEGVMGLFDGASPTGEEGSTAEIAKWLGAPVLLVIDAGGMARSFAAIADGFARFDPDLRLAGVIANRVGSRSHVDLLRAAIATTRESAGAIATRGTDDPDGFPAPPLLGAIPARGQPSFPSRHLGLTTASATTVSDADLEAWADTIATWWNLDAVVGLANHVTPVPVSTDSPASAAAGAHRTCRVGIAQDEAFHFYYEDNLHRLRALGATLVPFSPLADAALPPDLDGVYLGGGYPELHAATLASNHTLRAAFAAFATSGRPIYGECGGLMYLCAAIVTRDGARHTMLDLLPGTAIMSETREALGYVEVELQASCALGAPGLRFRGHQFRYSRLEGGEPSAGAYRVRKRRGGTPFVEGYQRGNVLGSYVHAHWASNPLLPAAFVDACARPRAAVRGNDAA
jgi:cobyrinic acid a,c-diamide synthase